MSEQTPDDQQLTIFQNIQMLRLVNGDEILGVVLDTDDKDSIIVSFPAKVNATYIDRSEGDMPNMMEGFVLTNYAATLETQIVVFKKAHILFYGKPIEEFVRLYIIFLHTVQGNQKGILPSQFTPGMAQTMTGLHLLNDLFNNENFVGFVNALMEAYDAEMDEIEDMLRGVEDPASNEANSPQEATPEPSEEEKAPKPQRKKKRRKTNPTGQKMDIPFDPTADPNTPEGWSDNPNDYLS